MTIGVFDGVHRGHQRIIGRAVEKARELGVPSVVLTFDPHPIEVVRPGSHPPMLTGQRYKADLVEELGVDVFCVLPFTVAFMRLTAAEFVHDVLVEKLHASAVVVGENFRYGHGGAGTVASLTEDGRRFGFTVEGFPLQGSGDMTWSSTYVRSCVSAGDVATAAEALGREHRIHGVVVRGDQRGREIGYPTANLEPLPWSAVPADGIYAGRLVRGKELLPAAISIGTNPTFAGASAASRPSSSTSTATCTASTSAWPSPPGCATRCGSTAWRRWWPRWPSTSSAPEGLVDHPNG